jgi:hypothetical protein
MSSTLVKDELTLLQAAIFLNVSPEYLTRKLRQGLISLDGLAAYKQERQKISLQALQQLADQAQELNMGY